MRRRVLLIAFAFVPALSAGCGSKSGEVHGKITIKGKAPNMDGFQISFIGPDGSPAMATISPEGTYKASGVPSGIVKVGLIPSSPKMPEPPESTKPRDGRPVDEKAATAAMQKFEQELKAAEAKAARSSQVPANLKDPLSSGLVVTVEAGKVATFDYDVK